MFIDCCIMSKGHESTYTSPSALIFSESLLKFTKYAIPPRIKFCKTHLYRPPELQAKMDRLKSQQCEERDRDDSTSDQEGNLKIPKIVA